MSGSTRFPISAVIAVLFAVSACGGGDGGGSTNPTPTPQPASLVESGGPLTAQVGETLTTGVTVLGSAGQPISGFRVVFAPISGGSVNPSTVTTGADGVALTQWTLGGIVGTQRLQATAGGVSVQIPATATLGDASVVVAVSGTGQSGSVESILPTPIVVEVQDAFGNPISAAPVSFSIFSGGGSVNPATSVSDSLGQASAVWTLGTQAGLSALRASSDSLTPAIIDATVLPGPASLASALSGDSQSGVGSLPLGDSVVVRVTDAFGNGIAGVEVTWDATAGGGFFEPSVSASDALGDAKSMWVLGPNLGANQGTGTIAGLTPVALTANATSVVGPPASITITFGNTQTAEPGQDVSQELEVTVLDAAGNPVPGSDVTFAVTGGGGTVQGGTQPTSLQGTASPDGWTLGPNPGSNTMDASVGGLATVTFTAEGAAPLPTGDFDIDIRFVSPMSQRQRDAFNDAALRWRQILIGDIQDIQVNLPADECMAGQPAVDEVVDDLIIFAAVEFIDDRGGTLASAGPCSVERSSGLPAAGAMRFDDVDIRDLELAGRLDEVIFHEMGHVLGVGTIWFDKNLLVGQRGGDPFFTGVTAIAEFLALGGVAVNPVPVANTGEAGTRDSHWRESVFGNEIMTGFINAGANPISRVTIGSMQDLGYVVNLDAAEPYSLPSPAAAVGSAEAPFRLNEVSMEEIDRIIAERRRREGR